MKFSPRFIFNNTMGAFADCGVLLPIVFLLAYQLKFSLTTLLLSAGALYCVSGLIYRVPMAIQPLKSIAIAAIGVGASTVEVRVAAALLGLTCLLLLLAPLKTLASKIPAVLVHGIQLGLGVILIRKGLEMGLDMTADLLYFMAFIALALSLAFIIQNTHLPLLGMVAFAGFCVAIFVPQTTPTALQTSVMTQQDIFRLSCVMGLFLPQIVLTLGNSVIGTTDVAHRYFAAGAKRVTLRSLLTVIGVGNIVSSLFSGLAFCHGSGGLTAHYRGGSSHWISNMIIGLTLIGLSIGVYTRVSAGFVFPEPILALLILWVGIFHFGLAQPSWRRCHESATLHKRLTLIGMGGVALIWGNMLWVMIFGVLIYCGYGAVHTFRSLREKTT